MPGADISQVQVTFGNGIKREEYGPLKKAEVSIVAIVGTGEDGVVALNYITKIAQAKVREMLTIQGQPAAAAAEPSPAEATARSTEAVVVGEGEQPERRTRRTKAEMEAARAAEAGQASSASATSVSQTSQPETASAPTTGSSPAEPATPAAASSAEPSQENEWDVGGAETVATITDQELNHTCSVTAERTSKPLAVREVIKLFNPGGDAFDPDKPGGRKFSIADIPQNQRADFIAKLKAL